MKEVYTRGARRRSGRDAGLRERRLRRQHRLRSPSGTRRWCSPARARRRSTSTSRRRPTRSPRSTSTCRPATALNTSQAAGTNDRHGRRDGVLARQQPHAAAERHASTTDDPRRSTSRLDAVRADCDERSRLDPEPERRGPDARDAALRQPDRRAPSRRSARYKLSICLPPPDVPVGTPGRAFAGRTAARREVHGQRHLHDADRRPASLQVGDALHAVQPRQGHAQRRRHVRGARVRAAADHPRPPGEYKKKTDTWQLNGKLQRRAARRVRGLDHPVARGLRGGAHRSASATTSAAGSCTTAGKLKPKKTTYFQVSAARRRARLHRAGCSEPARRRSLPPGCVSATLSPWTREERRRSRSSVKS